MGDYMSKKQIPFWEESYQDESVVSFFVQPNATVKEFEHLLKKQSRILEVGCGEGQNAVYPAQQVDAFDLSENGIAKLKRICSANNVQMNAFLTNNKKALNCGN